MVSRLVVATAVFATACLGGAAHADDQPLPGNRLVLAKGASREKLVVVLQDPSIVLPAPASSDDPSLFTGLHVQLFAAGGQDGAELVAAPGAGWSVRTGATTRYIYINRAAPGGPSPIRSIKIVEGKGVRIVARAAGLALTGQQGAIGVRIEMGTTRLCAMFDGDSVRRDHAGRFVARAAAAPAFSTCSDNALYSIPCSSSGTCDGVCSGDAECGGSPEVGCICASPSDPCGDTDPVCNGQCPTGEECGPITGSPFQTCGCLPAGSTPCGDVYPTCGDGDCPAGNECYSTSSACCGGTVMVEYCACLSEPPPTPCPDGCPEGWQCAKPSPEEPFTCIPSFCSGGSGAPVCDGTCSGPATCQNAFDSICFCLETCSGGSPYPTCGGTCTTAGTTCQPSVETGACNCMPD
jgi:hypothetical protein